MSNSGLPNFQGSKPSSQSRQMHRKEKQPGTNVAHNIMGGLQIIAMFHL